MANASKAPAPLRVVENPLPARDGQGPLSERTLPHSIESERALLGSILLEPQALSRAAAIIGADDLYLERHAEIWLAALRVQSEGRQVDVVSISAELDREPLWAEVGSFGYLTQLVTETPSAAHVDGYADTVRKLSDRRRAMAAANEFLVRAHDPRVDLQKARENLLHEVALLARGANNARMVHWAAEALESPEAVEWSIDGFLAAASLVLLYSDPGKGKTYAMLDLAVAFAQGMPWLGMQTKGGAALLIDEESGSHRLKHRLSEVLRGHDADPQTPVAFVSLGQFNFRNQSDALALRVLIEETGAGLVIIDALVDVMLGGDENAAQDVQPVFMHLRKVCEETGAVIILLHHSNKQGRFRGSTTMPGAVDCMLSLTREKGSAVMKISVEKARDIGEIREIAAQANWGEGTFNLSPAVAPASEQAPKESFNKAEAYVIRYLQAHGNSSLEDIKHNTDVCTPEAARRAVYNLTSRGWLGRVDEGGKGASAVYGLRRAVVV